VQVLQPFQHLMDDHGNHGLVEQSKLHDVEHRAACTCAKARCNTQHTAFNMHHTPRTASWRVSTRANGWGYAMHSMLRAAAPFIPPNRAGLLCCAALWHFRPQLSWLWFEHTGSSCASARQSRRVRSSVCNTRSVWPTHAYSVTQLCSDGRLVSHGREHACVRICAERMRARVPARYSITIHNAVSCTNEP
jgi:hypothetical protein